MHGSMTTFMQQKFLYFVVTQVYATFEPQPQPHRRATSSDMLQAIEDKQNGKDLVILDARGLEQYTGEASFHTPALLAKARTKKLEPESHVR